jgi:hypothetical protein
LLSQFFRCATFSEPPLLGQVLVSRNVTGTPIVSRLLEATPLLLATLYYILTPFFSGLGYRGYVSYLGKVNNEWQGPKVPLPPHLAPEALAANVDWLVDAPQMVPTLLLPLAAAVFAFHDSTISSIVLAFAAIVICVAALWIYSRSPLEYRSLRFIGNRYTVVAALGIVLNGTAAVLLIVH